LLLFKPIEVFNYLTNVCRKRKPRKNTTKGWFPTGVSTPDRDTNTKYDHNKVRKSVYMLTSM
jgi:hypothetical protein